LFKNTSSDFTKVSVRNQNKNGYIIKEKQSRKGIRKMKLRWIRCYHRKHKVRI